MSHLNQSLNLEVMELPVLAEHILELKEVCRQRLLLPEESLELLDSFLIIFVDASYRSLNELLHIARQYVIELLSRIFLKVLQFLELSISFVVTHELRGDRVREDHDPGRQEDLRAWND